MDDAALSFTVDRQYRAALAMLRRAIESCPDAEWDARNGESPFWQQAMHVLFYTHLYLDVLLYNLRHLQHHTGRLHSLLGRRGVVRLPWLGGLPEKSEEPDTSSFGFRDNG